MVHHKRRYDHGSSSHNFKHKQAKEDGGHTSQGTSEQRCYYCDKPGHFKRDCLKHKAKMKQVNTGLKARHKDHDSDSDIAFVCQIQDECLLNLEEEVKGWIIDSGATSHMNPNKIR